MISFTKNNHNQFQLLLYFQFLLKMFLISILLYFNFTAIILIISEVLKVFYINLITLFFPLFNCLIIDLGWTHLKCIATEN